MISLRVIFCYAILSCVSAIDKKFFVNKDDPMTAKELADSQVLSQELKQRYEEISIREAWAGKVRGSKERLSPLFQMNGRLYDQMICDSWMQVPPPEENFPPGMEKLPMILAFVKKPIAGFPDTNFAKDNFVLKTLHLLAQDFQGVFNFSYVILPIDDYFIGSTYDISQSHGPTILLIQSDLVHIASKDLLTYQEIAGYIQGDYQSKSQRIVRIEPRISLMRKLLRMGLRKATNILSFLVGSSNFYFLSGLRDDPAAGAFEIESPKIKNINVLGHDGVPTFTVVKYQDEIKLVSVALFPLAFVMISYRLYYLLQQCTMSKVDKPSHCVKCIEMALINQDCYRCTRAPINYGEFFQYTINMMLELIIKFISDALSVDDTEEDSSRDSA